MDKNPFKQGKISVGKPHCSGIRRAGLHGDDLAYVRGEVDIRHCSIRVECAPKRYAACRPTSK